MTGRSALVTGASIAGLASAYWLARTGWRVTVLERAAEFRGGGQNVDIRGAAHEVVERMGLTAKVRENGTTEEGTAFLGRGGKLLGRIPADREKDGPTAELEILRGDLARLILEALPESVDVRYDDRVTGLRHGVDAVSVDFVRGGSAAFDLVVVAEGVGSRTRDLAFPGVATRRELGLNMAYGTIPRVASDDRWWRWYTAPRRRGVTLRPDNVGTIRATLAYVDHRSLADLDPDEAARVLVHGFRDAGWESSRVASAFLDSDDVYIDYLTQIHMPTWHTDRVVVTGDAAWCVTPLGGGGTSLALTGAYVLGAYLSHSRGREVEGALREYERWMRPLITDTQKLPPGTPNLFYPRSALGVGALRAFQRVMTTRPLRAVAAKAAHVADTDQELPDMRADTHG